VFAVKAFPAAAEERYISLRHREPSGREHELGMIRSLVAWPRSARAAVGRSLGRRYLFHAIDAVRQIRSDENRVDLLVVAGGVRTRVQVDNRGDNFHRFGLNGLLLLDVKGSYYVIADRAALPKRQRNLLELYFGD
jgi:hypothetical protein